MLSTANRTEKKHSPSLFSIKLKSQPSYKSILPDCPHNPVTDRKLHKLFLRQKISLRNFSLFVYFFD